MGLMCLSQVCRLRIKFNMCYTKNLRLLLTSTNKTLKHIIVLILTMNGALRMYATRIAITPIIKM